MIDTQCRVQSVQSIPALNTPVSGDWDSIGWILKIKPLKTFPLWHDDAFIAGVGRGGRGLALQRRPKIRAPKVGSALPNIRVSGAL